MIGALRARVALACASATLCCAAQAAPADLIDVQFGQPTAWDGFPATQAYVGAAVLGAPGDLWNLETTFSPIGSYSWGASGTALKDAAGTSTPVTLSYASTGPVRRDTPFTGTLYEALMTSYLSADSPGSGGLDGTGPGVVKFEGLLPDTSYQLVLYSVGDVPGRATRFTAGDGAVSKVVRNNGQSTFAEGANYANLSLVSSRYGELSIIITHAENLSGFPQGNLNGMQLVGPIPAAVPEPASAALMAVGLAGLILRRRGTPGR